MRLLVLLRLFQPDARFVRDIGIIGTAILLIMIEKESIESARQIIMMGDVRLGSGFVIGPPELLPDRLETAVEHPLCVDRPAAFPRIVSADHRDELHDTAALDDDAAIDPGFGKTKPGIPNDIERHLFVGEAHGQIGEIRIGCSNGKMPSIRLEDRQLAPGDQTLQYPLEQFHAATLSPESGKVKPSKPQLPPAFSGHLAAPRQCHSFATQVVKSPQNNYPPLSNPPPRS